MSVRAYLVKESKIQHVNNELIITKRLKDTPTFNVTRHPEIFELFCKYGQDNTNDDLIGEISIAKDDWNKLNISSSLVDKITKDFNDNDVVVYQCL